jgi:hypothetical protein
MSQGSLNLEGSLPTLLLVIAKNGRIWARSGHSAKRLVARNPASN